jgi:hypothetical protein
MSSQPVPNIAFPAHVKLSVLRAMLGEVTPNLRAVGFKVEDKTVKIFSYYDGPIDEDDKENVSCMETEVMSDFWPDYQIIWRCARRDYPERMADIAKGEGIEHFVYVRKEAIAE